MALRLSIGAAGLIIASCSGSTVDRQTPEAGQAEMAQPAVNAAARPTTTTAMVPDAAAVPAGPATFIYDGPLTQGGWIRGRVPAGSQSVTLNGEAIAFDKGGNFFAAFDRDAGQTAALTAQLGDGRAINVALTIAPRAWKIENINLARPTGKASEAFMIRRRPELAQINAARKVNAQSGGWQQNFIWPVKGRISSLFGNQRIYAGVPASYHSGIDIATGESGTAYVAPADGVVVLAAKTPFSLEGYLLIIDHGHGLNSAFLHNSKLVVSEGDIVKQGQYVGNIGSTGSATGPHLHWSLKWNNARLDPLLFTGPMH